MHPFGVVRTKGLSEVDDNLKINTREHSNEGGSKVKLKMAVGLLLLLSSTGCILVGGYSSDRGWFIWPGTFVLLLVGLALFLLFNRRR